MDDDYKNQIDTFPYIIYLINKNNFIDKFIHPFIKTFFILKKEEEDTLNDLMPISILQGLVGNSGKMSKTINR